MFMYGTTRQKALETGNTLHRGPVGEIGGGSFSGTFKRQMKGGSGNEASLIKLFWAPFLDPDYVRSLSLGALWNFCEAPMTWNQNMGYTGPVMRHRCMETESA